jgi:FdhD protein
MQLANEEPLAIRVQGSPYMVVMRTPGLEKEHAAGLCLTEGLIDRLEDIQALAVCDDEAANVVTVTLTEERRPVIAGLLERRGYISQTSCGVCGKEVIEDLYTKIQPLAEGPQMDVAQAQRCLAAMSRQQPLRMATRATHASLIYDAQYRLLSAAEDIGRHNALDKAIGRLVLEANLDHAHLLLLSSRISYELVQKAARARIAIIVALSRPTGLAVDLASRLNITLASRAADDQLFIYTHPERFANLEIK